MTETQRALVKDNLGLVGVHLRRFLPRASRREWDDLFQEGCLGLIRAAILYDPQGGMEFPRFAFSRIRCAVGEALFERRRPVAMPRVPRQRRRGADGKRRHDPNARPDPRTLAAELSHYCLHRRQNPSEPPDGETIGSRLRGKIDRALRQAAAAPDGRRTKRSVSHDTASRLVEDRLLVPQPESRVPLRRIARETGSSCAGIIKREAKLLSAARDALAADPEFHELRERALAHPAGVNAEIDEKLEADLATRSATDFVARLRKADPSGKATLLAQLLEVSPAELDDLLAEHLARLPHELRENVLRLASSKPRQCRIAQPR
jgi:hypothetical protein